MVFVADSQVSHRRGRRVTGILGKVLEILRMRMELASWGTNLLPEEFPEQILSFPFRQDILLHQRHDQVAQDHIVQCL